MDIDQDASPGRAKQANHNTKPARAEQAREPKKRTLGVTRASDIEPENVRWLWRDQIALGKLTLIAGDPKIGKSLITADMAACVAAPKAWPDGSIGEHGDVLILAAEDDAKDTIIPRLMAAGCRREALWRVSIVGGLIDAEGKRSGFDFGAGFEALKDYVEQNKGLSLVIIDPMMAYMGRRDAHKAAEVRDALMPYTDLAATHGFAIVGVTHFNRGSSTRAFDRVIGSGAFTQVARQNYVVVEDEENDRCLLIPSGGNITAKQAEAFAYTIEDAEVSNSHGESVRAARVKWHRERVRITANDALERQAERRNGHQRTKQESAGDLILKALESAGEMPSDDLKDRVLAAGVTEGTYHKAHARLRADGKIKAVKGTGRSAPWSTKLLTRKAEGALSC